jgi:hypothetical protein
MAAALVVAVMGCRHGLRCDDAIPHPGIRCRRGTVAAQLAAAAMRCVRMGSITVDESVAVIHATLAAAGIRPGSDAARDALTLAAAAYAGEVPDPAHWFYPMVFRVLIEAGAEARKRDR